MGADNYVTKEAREIPVGVGRNCDIEGVILDKNVSLGEGVVIKPFARGMDMDEEHFVVRDGIVIIPKNTNIPAGTRITPEDI